MNDARPAFADPAPTLRGAARIPGWLRHALRRSLPSLAPLALFALLSGATIIWLNYWQNALINALAARASTRFWSLILEFLLILGSLTALAWLRAWSRGRATEALRLHLGAHFLRRYAPAVGLIEQDAARDSHLEQRQVDDVASVAEETSRLLDGALLALSRGLGAVVVLWTVIGTVSVGGLRVPGFMLWFALLTALVSMAVTHRFGRALAQLQSERVDRVAALRTQLARVREHAGAVALVGGGGASMRQALRQLREVRGAGLRLAWTRARTDAVSAAIGPTDILAWVVLAPGYFAARYSLGAVFQAANASGLFGTTLLWAVNEYASLAGLRGTLARLDQFDALLVSAAAARREARALRQPSDTGAWRWQGEVLRPAGTTPVLQPLPLPAELELRAGVSTLIHAESGFGKSLFLQALAGSWPHVRGRIEWPAGRVAFVAQRSFLPHGTLAAALAYPAPAARLDPAAATGWLQALRLGHLAAQLDAVRPWQSELSGGEIQRLALIRALLTRPQWLFLDEATSALDESLEDSVLQQLRAVPGCTLVCVSHSRRLARHFEQVFEWTRAGGADGTVIEFGSARTARRFGTTGS